MRYLFATIMLLVFFSNTEAGKRNLTLDSIYGPEDEIRFSGEEIPRLEWSESGEFLLKKTGFTDGLYTKIEAQSGDEESLVDPPVLSRSLEQLLDIDSKAAVELLETSEYQVSPGEAKLLVCNPRGLFLFDPASRDLSLLAGVPLLPEIPSFDPAGKLVSFVSEGDLYLVELESGKVRRLTTRAGDQICNGHLDWVYQEEVYGRGDFKGYWWSPDSRKIAFLRLDVSQVPTATIVDHRGVHPEVETQRYPHPGDPNAEVALGVVTLEGGDVEWMDLGRHPGEDLLVVRVDWPTESGRLTAQIQNRTQTWLELLAFDPENTRGDLLIREESPAWVNVIGEPIWLSDGTFLWQSERTGYRQIYHYSSEGELLNSLTNGDLDVRALHRISEERGWVFFAAARDHCRDLHIFRVGLDGSGLKRISDTPGQHRANFNRQGTLFVDSWSDLNTPTKVFLKKADGSAVRTILENRVEALEDFNLSTPEFIRLQADDGFPLEAMMIKPPDFDPSEKYPVLVYTYGGPGAQSVLNRWGGKTYIWHQYLASQGMVIWVADSRIASGKGVRSAWSGYRSLGPVGLRDIEDGLDWLVRHPWIDRERIGIWGWSYGGYSTVYALTHSDYFKLGIAGAPVTDWRHYDSIYTERYMATPQENPEGYRESSALEGAGNIKGRLLLLHGAIDDNVHIQNSVSLADKLQKAGVQFDFMIYPGSRHGIRDPLQVRQMRELMTRFILRNLELPPFKE